MPGKFGEHSRSFSRALQTFQVHPLLVVRTAKSMNQNFYNIATTKYWAKMGGIFVIKYRILTLRGERKQKLLFERERIILFILNFHYKFCSFKSKKIFQMSQLSFGQIWETHLVCFVFVALAWRVSWLIIQYIKSTPANSFTLSQ